jgi:hypothetical protein
MNPLGKLVAFPAANLANLGHFAVCALLFGTSRHKDLAKPCTMVFTKASTQTKDKRKLLDRHKISNGSSIQKSEHRAAHEIPRKHLGEKPRWRRRRMLLRLVPTEFLALLDHDDGDCFLELCQQRCVW